MPYLRTLSRLAAEVSCPTCGTIYKVDRNEDGSAETELWPCHDDEHTHKLCEACRMPCDACGLDHCREALTDFGGEFLCRVCMDSVTHEQRISRCH